MSSEITSPQIQILAVLDSMPDVDQRTATQLARLDRSTGAELIERLARYGCIERRRDPNDLRRYLLQLTDQGRELLYEVLPLTWEVHEQLLEMVPNELRTAFQDGLLSFVEAGEARFATGPLSDSEDRPPRESEPAESTWHTARAALKARKR